MSPYHADGLAFFVKIYLINHACVQRDDGTVVQMALFRLCASFAKYFQTDYIGVLAGRIIEIVNEPDAKTQS